MKSIETLVTGSFGYVGSHFANALHARGDAFVNYDNLSTGFKELEIGGKSYIADINDTEQLSKVFSDHQVDSVVHFAASSQVGESNQNPGKYYSNNVAGTLNLLKVMEQHNVKDIVFSSTAAVFGNPEYTPIDESHSKNPINVYGRSKLMMEAIIEDFCKIHGFRAISLRYFNAAGAHPLAEIGEMHDPETHLIPLVLQAGSGKRDDIKIFGSDYDTKDGTCIRDYIHVMDLADAHIRALDHLKKQSPGYCENFNLGNGQGYSVNEVIQTAQKVVAGDNKEIKVIAAERRSGDPAVLVADSTKAQNILDWRPKYADLETIIQHAWDFEKNWKS